MRILSLCLSGAHGGLELYAFRAIELLKEYGHLKLVVVRPSTPLYEWVHSAGFDFEGLEAKSPWPIQTGWSLAKIIDDNSIDAVHINWGNDLNLALLAKRFSKRKPVLIYSRHMRIPGSKRDPYHRWIYKQVDRLIVTTKEMYDQATTNLPIASERVYHLYLGVQQPKSFGSEQCNRFVEELGLDRNRFSIGLFGRIEHAKGQHVFVDAARILVDSGRDVQAVIIGQAMDPTYYHELEQRINENALTDRIKLHGFIAEANRFMRCFDAVVLPSYCEHFGLVLIEAMCAGVAVVGTAAGGVPEIIDDGTSGLLCEPGSAIDLAEKIKGLYDDQSMRASLAQAGQERARQAFSERSHFQALCNHFEQAISEAGNSL